MKILDGKKLSEKLSLKLKKEVGVLKLKPKLVIIQVGNLLESNKYIERKKIYGEKIGAIVEHRKYPRNTPETKLISDLRKYNADKSTHGIIVQLPLPKQIDTEKIRETIDQTKSVDGGKYFIPATTLGILTLLDHYSVKIAGRKAVVVGRSDLVGKPTALALINRGATVTVCHSQTKNLKGETRQAEILIVAVGKPKLITKNHVSKNQIVIDVGINIVNGKLVGDVDFVKVSKIARAITPVPGGIGPMTVAALFQNLFKARKLQSK